ncbi:hypothetical protein QJQ45_003091 [Haematococcus lacustris]|nr:hypothetical protein QJQ45_003091 [Haematococcus lacustris]
MAFSQCVAVNLWETLTEEDAMSLWPLPLVLHSAADPGLGCCLPTVQEQRKQLRARVSAWRQRDAGGTPGTSTTPQQLPAAAAQPELPQQWWDDLFRDASRLDTPCEVPGAYTCPLTMEVFREPVITPAGHCYEQASILEHLSKVGPWDPLRRDVKVTPDMLVPNLALRTAVQLYLEEHPYAWGECR